jgi:hypothetical protein
MTLDRFIVREFTFDETQEQRDLQELSELQATLQSLHASNSISMVTALY